MEEYILIESPEGEPRVNLTIDPKHRNVAEAVIEKLMRDGRPLILVSKRKGPRWPGLPS